MTEILMPALSDSMEQGLLLQWLVADGAEVAVGTELCEIETDKATMTYESEVEGVLRIIAGEGSTVAVGEPIASVGAAPALAASVGAGAPAPALGGLPGNINGIPPKVESGAGAGSNGHTAVATPVARRLAVVHGIALAAVDGTGPRGRITKADVLGAAGVSEPARSTEGEPARSTDREPARSTEGEPARSPDREPARSTEGEPARSPGREAASPHPAPADRSRTVELNRLQQAVARRMAEAKSTIPHFQVQTEVRLDAASALRAQLRSAAEQLPGAPVPSLNDLIVKASALALRRHPHANGSYRDGRFELHDRVNVGIAVAADSALVVPTVFDADIKSLGQLASESRTLAERVRARTIAPPELSGATFTVSNLGMFGMTAITPVINPPQAAILGVGAARPTLTRNADSGEIEDAQLLTLTLSCDHRILYGADAARFLADVRALLEAPLQLALG